MKLAPFSDLKEAAKKLNAEKRAIFHEKEQLAQKVNNQRQEIAFIETKASENADLKKKLEFYSIVLAQTEINRRESHNLLYCTDIALKLFSDEQWGIYKAPPPDVECLQGKPSDFFFVECNRETHGFVTSQEQEDHVTKYCPAWWHDKKVFALARLEIQALKEEHERKDGRVHQPFDHDRLLTI